MRDELTAEELISRHDQTIRDLQAFEQVIKSYGDVPLVDQNWLYQEVSTELQLLCSAETSQEATED